MSTSTIATPAPVATYDKVCDALRDVHDEASLWRLSDELVKIAPQGVQAVDEVVRQAKVRGIPTKSTNTLRLYRDVAIRFPSAERVPLVSFSAHREAIGGFDGDAKKARSLLEDLSKKHGPEGVTVTTVKKAIGAATGNMAKVVGKVAPAAPATSYAAVAIDLSAKHGKVFVAELDAMLAVNGVTLDGLHAGLSAVLAEVEARRSKAVRKAAAAKAAAKPAPKVQGKASVSTRPTSRPAVPRSANGKAPVKKGGDLRGL
jgi:hypothetical protein